MGPALVRIKTYLSKFGMTLPDFADLEVCHYALSGYGKNSKILKIDFVTSSLDNSIRTS